VHLLCIRQQATYLQGKEGAAALKRLMSETVSRGLAHNLALPAADSSKQGTSCNESAHGAFRREVDNQGGNNGLRLKEAFVQITMYNHNGAHARMLHGQVHWQPCNLLDYTVVNGGAAETCRCTSGWLTVSV
jgi:hypothetical protein